MKEKIWISWQEHRRTEELCRSLSLNPMIMIYHGRRSLRYVFLAARTAMVLLFQRPRLLFVQNPSIALSFMGVVYKVLFNKKIIIDSHTSGILPFDGKYKMLNALSKFIQRKADITIVTNSFLRDEVERNGGRAYILQDKLPSFPGAAGARLKGSVNVVFICSFSWDEPYGEVIKAAARIDRSIYIYITGNYKKAEDLDPSQLPSNVILTGYLDEPKYIELLSGSDIIMDLTTRENCLLCGAYEAIALGKPYILSRTSALMEYFKHGAVFTENSCLDIVKAIHECARHLNDLQKDVLQFSGVIDLEWRNRFEILQRKIEDLYHGN